MARIIAVDTTAEFGSLALVDGPAVIDEVLLHAPDGFGQVLFGHLENLLGRHGWTLRDTDCFAAAAGPGSFTGVRVGLSAVKGLAEATGKPVVSVSNLAALAWFGSEELRATVLDARRGEVFAALYDARLRSVMPETVGKLPEWLASLPEGRIEFLSTDFAPFRPALAGTRFEASKVTDAPRALAGAVGRLAAGRLAQGLAEDPASVDASYVRRSDAELQWSDPGLRGDAER